MVSSQPPQQCVSHGGPRVRIPTPISIRRRKFWRLFKIMSQSQKTRVLALLLLGVITSFTFSVWTSKYAGFKPLRCLVVAKPRVNSDNSHKLARPNAIRDELHGKSFLFIAVMSSSGYISTRARGVWETWGKDVPGKLAFFTGRINRTDDIKDLPIIELEVPDNIYPPQTKSFKMIEYVSKHFVDKYEWFIRADDDVYLRPDKLRRYLLRLDSSDDLVIGQPGTGKKEEIGKLGLGKDDNFCLGGPGIMMTASVLRKVGPNIVTCLNQTASFHEDVEIGRCLRQFGGVMCPWGFEAKELFRQVYENPLEAYHGSLDAIEYIKGISFHPVKDPAYMRRMHVFFSTYNVHRFLIRQRSLHRTLKNIDPFLKGGMHWKSSRQLLSDHNDRTHRCARNSSQPWESFDFSKVWALRDKPPLRYIHDGTEAAMTKVVDFSREVLLRDGETNLYEKVSFDKWHKGYMRVDPKVGTEFLLDIGTKYQTRDPHQNVKITRTRRSVRIRQTFGKFLMRSEGDYGVSKTTLHFIVPLMGRLENFKRFLKSFEEEFILRDDPVKLLIIYFPDAASPVEQKQAFDACAKKYPSIEMKWLDVKGPFKRAVALQMGTDYFGNNSLLYFCDVDLVFRREFADRCRANAVLEKRAYFPVMFSQFNPLITFANKPHPGHYYYAKEAGFWRWYSFGPVCAYAKDIKDSGGLNTDLLGWGLEDVDLYEKFLKRNDIEIFRAPDPGLVHVYHPHAPCDPQSTEEQQAMCRAAQADIYSSAPSSVDYLRSKGYLGYFL